MNLKNLKHIVKEEISRLKEQKSKRPPISRDEFKSAIQNSNLDDEIKLMLLPFYGWEWFKYFFGDEPEDSDSSSTP